MTANKAMLAHHGAELAALAEESGAVLAFEAAVAGGIPIVQALREGLAANRIGRVVGILNGTCNYILTQMRETGRDFGAVLAEAQELGYAEADPSFDVDGIDAAHKLALLASLAFGGRPRFDAIHVEGIRHVSAEDIAFAGELGYRIKLLGVARMTAQGLEQRVHPCMVPADAPIAQVEGVFNGVVVEGDRVGQVMFEGRGAGAGPTASAVVADIVDIARGLRLPAFGVPARRLADHPIAPMAAHEGSYYIRLLVLDRPGVMADVSADPARPRGLDRIAHPARPQPGPGGADRAHHPRHDRGRDAGRAGPDRVAAERDGAAAHDQDRASRGGTHEPTTREERNLALDCVRVTEAAALAGGADDGPRRRAGG